MTERILKVLALNTLNEKADRDKTRGILRYAREHGQWELQFSNMNPQELDRQAILDWKPDGVISDQEHPCGAVVQGASAFVSFEYMQPTRRSGGPKLRAFVRNDPAALVRVAVERFIRGGFASFAYAGTARPIPWSAERCAIFSAELAKRGFTCSSFMPGLNDGMADARSLARWLKSLPKPCAMLVAADRRARQALDACREARIPVPSQISVIGIDNEEEICEATTPTLSSILPDFEGGGYLAAESLDRMMRGEPYAAERTYGAKGLIERMSSQDVSGSGRIVALAREEIRLHAAEGLRAEELARRLNVSPRLIQMRFREATGHTASEEIREARLMRVSQMLEETALPIKEVRMQCGVPPEAHLSALFLRRFGMTMSEWRERRAAPPLRGGASLAAPRAQIAPARQ